MNNETALLGLSWRRLAYKLDHQPIKATFLLLVLTAFFSIGAISFFVAGLAAKVLQGESYVWLVPLIFLLFGAGILSGTRIPPTHPSAHNLFITLAGATWTYVVRSLRVPLLLSLAGSFFYYGFLHQTYYDTSDKALVLVGLLALSLGLHLSGFAISRSIFTLSKNVIIRSVLLLGLLLFTLQSLLESEGLITALHDALASPSLQEISLLILGSVGLLGAATALTEVTLQRGTFSLTPHFNFWAAFARTRNLRASFSIREGMFLGTVLYLIRNGRIHQRLAVAILLFIYLVATANYFKAPLESGLYHFLWGATAGVLMYHISFKVGGITQDIAYRTSHLPVNRRSLVAGTFAASGLIGVGLAGILAAYLLSQTAASNPLHLSLLVVVAIAVHAAAFIVGLSTSKDQHADLISQNEVYGILITTVGVLLAYLAGQFWTDTGTVLAYAVILVWSAALLLTTTWLTRRNARV